MGEIWKDVAGYEGLYKISSSGSVKSFHKSEKIMSLNKEHRGYLQIVLCKNKIHKTFKAHRLVAEAFIPNPNNYPQVNHIDENKLNNNVENLEWCSAKYNMNYGLAAKTRHWGPNRASEKVKAHARKVGMRYAKKVVQLDMENNFIKKYESIKAASRECGINNGGISKSCAGTASHAGGYQWRFANE